MGTANGARKARERMRAKLLAEAGMPIENLTAVETVATARVIDGISDISAQGNLDRRTDNQGVTASGGESAAQILRDSSPTAAKVLQRVVDGSLRSPPHVRVQAACRVLESQGLLGQQLLKPAAAAGDATVLALLERIGSALAVRTPVTVDAEPARE